MPELPARIDSTFRYILVAAKRAEQLIAGARPRLASRHVKPTTIALAELESELIPWRSVTPEEYEALRQQEAAHEAEEHVPPIFPAIPPAPPVEVEPEAEAEEEEDDDELEEDLEGPKPDDLEAVDDASPDELLTEDLPPEE